MPFPYNVFALALVSAGLTTALAVPFWQKWCRRAGVMDDPGQRKLHSTPVPLAGGLAVMTGVLVPVLAGVLLTLARAGLSRALLDPLTARIFGDGLDKEALQLAAILAGAVGMLLIGLCDDKVELRPAVKFGGQLLVALLVAAAGVRITCSFPACCSAMHYHFVDFDGGQRLQFHGQHERPLRRAGRSSARLVFGLIAASRANTWWRRWPFSSPGALAGFLPYNFPKASAFLGDSGSHLVGYLLAVLAILPHFYTLQTSAKAGRADPLLVLAVPLGDLAWVVLLRWKMGRPFYVGDTNHLSHRLVRRGLSRTRAVLVIWLLAAALGALAFLWQ